MKKLKFFVTMLLAILANGISAQLYFTVKPMPEPQRFGVYVQPCMDQPLSLNTITGSGQVTMIVPVDAVFLDVISVSGTWEIINMAIGPEEAPNEAYYSIGLLTDVPQITYVNGEETLLFTVKVMGDNIAQPELIENGIDPFDQLPNSFYSNPGNDLSVIDFGNAEVGFYEYSGNYSGELIDCGDDPPSVNNSSDPVVDPFFAGAVKQGEKLNKKMFAVMPNPASDHLRVDFGSELHDNQSFVRLWDSFGNALLKMEKGSNPSLNLNIWELPPGLYFITYESEGRVLQRERFYKN